MKRRNYLIAALFSLALATPSNGSDSTPSAQARRGNPAVLRQLAGLTAENTRLRSELDALGAALLNETAASQSTRLATAEAAASEAVAKVQLKELEFATSVQRAAAEASAAKRTELEAAAAAANSTAMHAAAEAAHVSLEASKVRERVAAAEAERAKSDAAREAASARVKSEQVRLAELQAAQLSALSEAAASNASRAVAESERVQAEARVAEERRRAAEASAREAEAAALSAAVAHKLAALRASAASAVAGLGEEIDSSSTPLTGLAATAAAAADSAARLAGELSHATEASAAARLLAAQQKAGVEALAQAIAQGRAALEGAKASNAEREVAAAKRAELEHRHLELHLKLAEEQSRAAAARQAHTADELKRAEAARGAAEAQLALQRAAARIAADEAAKASAMAAAADAASRATSQRLAAAELEALGHRNIAEAAASSAKELQARARAVEAELEAVRTARQTAALSAAEAEARATTTQAEAQAAMSRAQAAASELERTREARAAAESDERAAILSLRSAEAARVDTAQQAQAWASKHAVADSELASARVALQTAHAQKDALATQLQVATVQAQAAADHRVASLATAEAEASRVAAATEARVAAEAAVAQERVRVEAANAEVYAAEARVRLEAAAQARELAVTAAQAEAKQHELSESHRLALERDAARLTAEEESALRREATRRGTELAVAALTSETEARSAEARARVDAEARLRDVRENEDVHARAAAADAAAVRERWVTTVSAALDRVGVAAHMLLTVHLQRVILAMVALAGGVYGCREGLLLARGELQRRLGAPSLVRDTSVPRGVGPALRSAVDALTCGGASAVAALFASLWGVFVWAVDTLIDSVWEARTVAMQAVQGAKGSSNSVIDGAHASAADGVESKGGAGASRNEPEAGEPDPFHDVVLSPAVEAQVRRLAASTANAHAHGAPLRHALFYGPPGTGKSLVATRLARVCGLDYAIMAGGDVAPLGTRAVTELHRLFDWAQCSPRGLLIFIDEAETFLGSRSRAAGASAAAISGASGGDDATRHALSALLARTGDAGGNSSSGCGRVMLVLATNRPGDLDEAVVDRVDECVHFDHPDARGRVRLARLYFHRALAVRSQYGPRGARFFATETRPLPSLKERQSLLALDSNDTPTSTSLIARIAGACTRSAAHHGIRVSADLTLEELDSLAAACKGFSGRQMAKLMTAVQAAVYAQPASSQKVATGGRRRRRTGGAAASQQQAAQLSLELLREVVQGQAEGTQARASFHPGSPVLTAPVQATAAQEGTSKAYVRGGAAERRTRYAECGGAAPWLGSSPDDCTGSNESGYGGTPCVAPVTPVTTTSRSSEDADPMATQLCRSTSTVTGNN